MDAFWSPNDNLNVQNIMRAPPQPQAVSTTPPQPQAVSTTPPQPQAVSTTPPQPQAVSTTPPQPQAVAAWRGSSIKHSYLVFVQLFFFLCVKKGKKLIQQ